MRQPAKDTPSLIPLVSGMRVRHDQGTEIAPHTHRQAQFTVVLKGTMKIRSDRGWWLAPAGRGIWIPPGLPHASAYSEAASFVLLKIAPEAGARLFAEPRTLMVSDLLRELTLEMCRNPASEDMALLSDLIVRRIGAAASPPALFLPAGRDARLLRLMEMLQHDPGQTTPFSELARRAGSSTRTLSRLFLAETGMSFAQWRNHLRIVTAVDLLVRGTPVIRVALALGYQSQSSFTTMFTRIIGMPPRRYLQQLPAQQS